MASDDAEGMLENNNSGIKSAEKVSGAIKDAKREKEKLQAAIFLSAVTGISAFIGFGSTIVAARKQDPKYFNEGISGAKGMTETGASLALRALGLGTLCAFAGCGVLFYGIWKVSGASNAKEFRMKMGSILPQIPKNNPPRSRTEFEGLTDLLNYISEDWGKEKAEDSK